MKKIEKEFKALEEALPFKIPESEVLRIKENMHRQKVMAKLLGETTEFNEQRKFFNNWVKLINMHPDIFCPKCRVTITCPRCGADRNEMVKLAGDLVTEHATETTRVHKKIKQEHPELEMIPLPREAS